MSDAFSITVEVEIPEQSPIISSNFMQFLREQIYTALFKYIDEMDVLDKVRIKDLLHHLSFLECYLEDAVDGAITDQLNEDALKRIPSIVNLLEEINEESWG